MQVPFGYPSQSPRQPMLESGFAGRVEERKHVPLSTHIRHVRLGRPIVDVKVHLYAQISPPVDWSGEKHAYHLS
jgi:hypothetical protein